MGSPNSSAQISLSTVSRRDGDLAYRPDIDGLRAVAIISVLAFHAFPTLVPGGFIGVDIFFVISGYLIAGNIFGELDANTFSLVDFYKRRVLRLFPALVVVLAACLLAGSIFLLDIEYRQLANHVIWGSLGFANITVWQESGYFDQSSRVKPLLHLWSLGVEEQFYLVAAITLVAIQKARARTLIILITAAILSFVLHGNWLTGFEKSTIFFLPFFRAWELLVGVVLACCVRKGVKCEDGAVPIWILFRPRDNAFKEQSRLPLFVACLGLIAILAGIINLNEQNFSYLGALLPTFGSASLILAGQNTWINKNILSQKLAVLIGLISYPLYLWHWPIFSFSNILGLKDEPAMKVMLITLSVVLAFATWKYVEKPVRSNAISATGRPAQLFGAIACILFLATTILMKDGRVGWAGAGGAVGKSFTHAAWDNLDCSKKFWGTAAPSGVHTLCSNVDPAGVTNVALIGDSHAWHLFTGLESYYQYKSKSVVNFYTEGCLWLSKSYSIDTQCRKKFDSILDQIYKLNSVDTVILSHYTPPHMLINQEYIENARILIKVLIAHGKRVILMLDIPQLKNDPRDCIHRPLQFWVNQNECLWPENYYEVDRSEYRAAVERAIEGLGNVRVFDVSKALCERGCRMKDENNAFLYQDNNHLNNAGSIFVSRSYDF